MPNEMDKISTFFKYLGYITVSLLLGWLSHKSGDENDFVLKVSSNLIPLLITIIAFYMTIVGLIIKELISYKEKTKKDVSNVIKSLRRDTTVEICIVCGAFICYLIRGAVSSFVTVEILDYFTIISNSVTVFSFFYFLWLIYDSVMGLWDLIDANNKQ